MQIVEHFFFNLSLMVVLLFFSALWTRRTKAHTTKVLTRLFMIVSLIVCFLFSYQLNDSVILDLRLIPFLIGAFYAGMGVVLAILSVIIRGYYSFDFGFICHSFLYLFLAHLSIKWAPLFLSKPPKQRIAIIALSALTIGIMQSIVLGITFNEYSWYVYFSYLFIQPVGAGMVAFFLEELCKSFKYKSFKVESKKLEAVEQMGAAISHEIRNPLTAALGFVQLLENDYISDEERNLYLTILKNELHSAENVIHDYLTFSNPEIEKDQIDLVLEVTNVVLSLKPQAISSNVRIITVLPKSVVIEGDRQKLRQSLQNIMKNAIEAMETGGILKVKLILQPSSVIIRIKDTGPGMTQEQIERIGEPYYSTKGDKGTGLGLMVVLSIIRAMNGTIHIESTLGKGTCFEITLPVISSESEVSNRSNVY